MRKISIRVLKKNRLDKLNTRYVLDKAVYCLGMISYDYLLKDVSRQDDALKCPHFLRNIIFVGVCGTVIYDRSLQEKPSLFLLATFMDDIS